eukprot:scaffold1875_cov339-Prasinococcus_capsulatus_cf.AAC.5
MHAACAFAAGVAIDATLSQPSNHLDPPAIRALARGLTDWSRSTGGTVVVSSHSETFMQALDVTHVVRVGDGRATISEEGLRQYVSAPQQQ